MAVMRMLVIVAVVLAGVTARAETPCAADITRFCKDTASGEGRIRTCLLSHAKELAPACRARIDAPAAAGPAMGAQQLIACDADLEKHCAKVPSGGGRLRACLREHAGEVTPACKAALARGPETPKPAKRAPTDPARR